MGMCKPSGGKFDVYGPYRGNIGPLYNKPNTRIDYYDEETGNLLQQRWYDSEGKAIRDRDWNHGNQRGNHKFPHDHYWDWTTGNAIRKEYKGPLGEDTNFDYC